MRPHQDRREPIDLVQLARRVIASHGSDAATHAVRLIADLPAEPVQVIGDRIGFEQVLVNLIDNGIDAAGMGGVVGSPPARSTGNAN